MVALLCLSSWWLMIVVWVFLAMSRICLQFVIVVVPDHTHLLFLTNAYQCITKLDEILRRKCMYSHPLHRESNTQVLMM